jgi:3-deoxy-manno-octulosonate cytidylyltransferase (CMP-KDO synthetase)
MIQHVYERALAIDGVDEVLAATDSPAVEKAVRAFGGRALMTSPGHLSGSDRLAEAADLLGLSAEDVVINVQGDQPAFEPGQAASLARALREEAGLEMSTLAVALTEPGEIRNPNHVKVVFDANQMALYFSRAPIPWPRDGGPGEYFKHIGLYAYRAGFLRRFVSLPPGRLEQIEKLEQLRALENGARIKVLIGRSISPEVDVPEDVAAAEAALSAALKAGEYF